MNDNLYLEQLKLEEEARGLTIKRFHKEHLKGTQEETFGETFLGASLIKHYMVPFTQGIAEWSLQANSGRAGRKNLAAKLLDEVDHSLAAFLMLKAIFNKVGVYHEGKPCSLTALAIYGAGLIHDELRLREFDREFHKWSKKVHEDFNKRELPRYKREEYMQKVFQKAELEWATWSKSDMVHVGTALLSIFKDVTGDIEVRTTGSGKAKRDVVFPSEGLLEAIQKNTEKCEALFTTYFPTVIPPLDWTPSNLSTGCYHTHHVSPYPLVKASKKAYRETLKELAEAGRLDRVLNSVNALQRTRWAVNERVLDAVEYVYRRNIPCGKLPRADSKVPDPAPKSLEGLPADHEAVKAYRAYCFTIHEYNRRIIGKRVMAGRAFQLARKLSKYEAIYFPHDLDSRGRAYPKPSGLNPQGPDYVKGILHFASGKPLGRSGVKWLAIHGANCWGEDKLPLDEREDWGRRNLDLARRVARNPRTCLEWTGADQPCQFLAWCFEWAEAHEANPEDYLSRLHVDLDATCSGLQHFSAMLRDAVGGFHVNMVPCEERQDVYGAVATETLKLIEADLGVLEPVMTKQKDGTERPSYVPDQMAKAWMDFGVTRKITKRPVMVKPYSGTRTSCGQYVAEAVDECLDDGYPLPYPKDEMWTFKVYGADKVWKAIPKVVVAADGAMKWLMTVARLVGKSQPEEKRIEWITPLGLPVHQYKFDTRSRQVRTFFDGKVLMPRISEDTDRLDPRQMASSIPPSFVHSLDAAHLQATIARAVDEGITDFAAVHDSFGVHACDVERFSRIIREAFVDIYENHDVLSEFLESAEPLISEELKGEIPPVPLQGTLDLQGVLENQFFFS